MAVRARLLVLASALVCAVVAGGGSSHSTDRLPGSVGTDRVASVPVAVGFDSAVVPTPAGGALTLVAGRSPVLTSEAGAFTSPPLATLISLAVALVLAVRVDLGPNLCRGLIRRRGPPSLLFARA
jgi:hypothetical protein